MAFWPNFHSLAEKEQLYQRPSFLGTTPSGVGRGCLKRPMSENQGKALIFGVRGSEMPSSAPKGNTPQPSRSRPKTLSTRVRGHRAHAAGSDPGKAAVFLG